MESLQLSKDKYSRTLAIINANENSIIERDVTGNYMTVLVVDTHDEEAMGNLGRLTRKLADNKVFTIAIFATGQYDWTFDNALMFGINAWFVTSSIEEAVEIANGIKRIARCDGQFCTDLADIKTILYKSEGRKAYYGAGESNSNNLNTAFDNAVQNAKEYGMSVYDCCKYLISISTTTELTKEQMNDLNDFIKRLSEIHSGIFEIKWGLTAVPDSPIDALKVTLLASY